MQAPDDRSKIKPADKSDVKINLKGMAIGNPYMDPHLQTVERLECGLELGFLDTKQFELLSKNADKLQKALDKKPPDYQEAFNYNQGIKKNLIACGGNVAIYDVRTWDLDLVGPMVEAYFHLDAVKEGLHVPINQPWMCADETGPVTYHLMQDFMTPSSQTSLRPLLDKEVDGKPVYRVMLYTGNLDMSCGVAGTEKMLQNLDWSHAKPWKKLDREVWAAPKNQTKGFVKSCANLTQMVIPGSGHMVPSCQPEVSLEMINHFIHNRKFPTYKTPIPKEYPDEISG